MASPLILYSVNSLLAFRINERYYQQRHFVWCNRFFSGQSVDLGIQMPPSSTPKDLLTAYRQDVERGDRHSSRLEGNLAGIRKGMVAKRDAGVLTEALYLELEEVLAAATIDDFRPLLYVIPFQGVEAFVERVPPRLKAAPFSEEYLIGELPRPLFDVLDF